MSDKAVENDAESPKEVASSYLLGFFSSGGRSVLIRGDPGTGKTSLVLQLLDYHSRTGFRSIYMSTRLSAKTLKSHQPWVEVVQGKYGTVPRLEEDQIGFQDSRRMDGVRAISGLRQYLEQVPNPFVVLDSWEGLFFESHNLGVEEISKLVEDYDARFVVVTERREQTDLDYLLDGVVVLRRKFHEQRVVREMELKKLRGVSIKQSRFLFTLNEGRFRFLPPFEPVSSPASYLVGSPIKSRSTTVFSTGNETLDEITGGGLEIGSLNLLELSNDVPFEITSVLLRTIVSNFINLGHKFVFVPFIGAPEFQLDRILPNFSKETISESVTVLSFDHSDMSESEQWLKGEAEEDFDLIASVVEEKRKESKKPVLVAISQDTLEGLYGSDAVSKLLARSIAKIESLGNVRIQITRPESSLLEELKAFSDTDLKVEMLHGTPIVFSIKPMSVLHALVLEDSVSSTERRIKEGTPARGGRKPELVPIV